MPPHIVERHNLHPLLIVRGCGNPAREEHLPNIRSCYCAFSFSISQFLISTTIIPIF